MAGRVALAYSSQNQVSVTSAVVLTHTTALVQSFWFRPINMLKCPRNPDLTPAQSIAASHSFSCWHVLWTRRHFLSPVFLITHYSSRPCSLSGVPYRSSAKTVLTISISQQPRKLSSMGCRWYPPYFLKLDLWSVNNCVLLISVDLCFFFCLLMVLHHKTRVAFLFPAQPSVLPAFTFPFPPSTPAIFSRWTFSASVISVLISLTSSVSL